MMAAMMLPSATPMIRLHRLGAEGRGLKRELWSAIFVAGYLIVWGLVGIVVWGAAMVTEMAITPELRAIAAGALLLVAGVYQFTPLKSACLRECRTPADFLMTHWRRGLGGQLRLGVEHGLYCVGCCWALMAIFVGVGAMSIPWAAAIATVVLVEKVVPHGIAFGRILGAILVIAALLVLVRPELVAGMGTAM